MIQETPERTARPGFPETSTDAGAGRPAQSSEDNGQNIAPGIGGPTELEVLAEEAARLVREGLEQTERRIRRHPLASVGIAAGVGLLFGLLCGRRG